MSESRAFDHRGQGDDETSGSTRMRGRWQSVIVVAAAAVVGCSSVEQSLIERGYPPAYAEGYEHGCASGKAAAGGLFAEAQKDESRYRAGEGEYAQGWDAGYAKCLSDMRAMVTDARTRNPSREK